MYSEHYDKLFDLRGVPLQKRCKWSQTDPTEQLLYPGDTFSTYNIVKPFSTETVT